MKRIISLVLVSLMLLAVLCGCGGTEESGSKKESGPAKDHTGATIAVCMGSINNPVHRIAQAAFVTRGKELGYNATIAGLDEGSSQELIAKIESTITNGAEGIMLWCGDDGMYEMMRDLKDMTYFVVPHFAHEYSETKNFISRNVSANPRKYGAAAADFIIEKLTAKGVTNGSIGLTQNGPNITENAATDAFRARINELGVNFKCIDVVYEGDEVNSGATKITGIIQSNPNIVAGFGTTGSSAQAWYTAMENTGKKDLVVVGVDYTEYNQQLVKEGKIAGIVAQPLWDEASLCVDSLDELFHGKQYTEEDWFCEKEAPVAFAGGEGNADINYYADVITKVKAFFE